MKINKKIIIAVIIIAVVGLLVYLLVNKKSEPTLTVGSELVTLK